MALSQIDLLETGIHLVHSLTGRTLPSRMLTLTVGWEPLNSSPSAARTRFKLNLSMKKAVMYSRNMNVIFNTQH